jgi:hypothetical protein
MRSVLLYEYWDLGRHFKVWQQTMFGYTTTYTTQHWI